MTSADTSVDAGTTGDGAVRPASDPSRNARHAVVMRIRNVLLGAYALAYVWWFFARGLIVDRITAGISILAFLVIAYVGKPWRAWARLPLDVALYAAMWFVYDETRGAADHLGFPLQVDSVINIDRAMFFGQVPTVWLQDHIMSPVVRPWDVIASVTYFSHFIVPVVVIAVLWVSNRTQWIRFMRRLATVLAIACIMFVLLPTAPPWMAGGGSTEIPLDSLPPVHRTAGRGWRELHLGGFVHTWDTGRDWANPTAAMPSLHAGFSLFVVLFFLPRVRNRWLRALMLLYPLTMAMSVVYLGEHYVIDVLAGWAIVGLSFLVWNRLERRWAERAIDEPDDGMNDAAEDSADHDRDGDDPDDALDGEVHDMEQRATTKQANP